MPSFLAGLLYQFFCSFYYVAKYFGNDQWTFNIRYFLYHPAALVTDGVMLWYEIESGV
jgi:hypothetical protein